VYSLELEGKRRVLPTIAEILAVVDAMRASEMGIFKEKGLETRVYRRSGDLAKGKTDVLCDLRNQDVELQHLELSSDYQTSELIIEPYKADGELDIQLLLTTNAGGQIQIRHDYIHDHESIAWFELIYETGFYKFGLGYPLRFSNGVKVSVKNNHPTLTKKLACEIICMIRG